MSDNRQFVRRAERVAAAVRIAAVVLDAGRRIVASNHAFFSLFGIEGREVSGRRLDELGIPGLEDRVLNEGLAAVLETGETLEGAFLTCTLPGLGKSKLAFNAGLIDEAPRSLLVSFELPCDDELRKREASFRAIAENTPHIIVRVDRSLRHLYVNPIGREATGIGKSEVTGKTMSELGLSDDIIRFWKEKYEKVFESGREVVTEFEAGGRYFSTRIVPECGRNGRAETVLAIGSDVTALKRAQDELARKEAQYRTLVENSPDIVTRYDPDLRLRYINPIGERVTGLFPDKSAGGTLGELGVPPPVARRWEEALRSVLKSGRSGTLEFEYFSHVDGVKRVYHADLIPEYSGEGTVASVLTITRDITGIKEAERKLEEARRQADARAQEAERGRAILNAILENVPEEIMVVSAAERKILAASAYSAELTGYPREEFEGISLEERTRKTPFFHSDGVTPAVTAELPLSRALEKGERITGEEWVVQTAGGERKIFLITSVPVREANGSISGAIATWQDISGRRRMEEELRTSGEEYRTLVESMNNIIMRWGTDGRMQFLNRYGLDFFGFSADELFGKPLLGTIVPERESTGRDLAAMLVAVTHRPQDYFTNVNENIKKNGERVWISWANRILRDREGKPVALLSSGTDITDRKRAEDTLRRNEYELRTLVENSADVIARFSRELRYTFVNPAFERLTGLQRENVVGRKNGELGMAPQQAQRWDREVRSVIDSGREGAMELDFSGIFGRRYFLARIIPEFARSGLVESTMLIARDVTDLRHAEERVRYISFHDSVTGLYNRAWFQEELRRLDTERSLPLSILACGIHHLRLTNDLFGRAEGDRLLAAVAGVLREVSRQEDIFARWSGEAFAALLPGTTREQAARIVERIRAGCAAITGTALPAVIALGAAAKERPREDISAALRDAEEEMRRARAAEVRPAGEAALSALEGRLRARLPDIDLHERRLSELLAAAGRAARLSQGDAAELLRLAKLHDVGKAAVPGEILLKPGPLTPDERAEMERYPELGRRVAVSLPGFAGIAELVLSQAERWDGRGYPRRLKGAEIPLLARLFRVADVFDVLTHDRPYGPALSVSRAAEELRRGAGVLFDPALVALFLDAVLVTEQAASRP